jgi:hypothetical protein
VKHLLLAATVLACAAVDEPPPPLDDPVTFALLAMQEPPVGHLAESDQAFRWVWLRSFHPPVVVRVQKQGSEASIVVKMLDKPYGAGPDGLRVSKLAINEHRRLNANEWDSLVELRRAGFWAQPSTEPEVLGVDGADWIMDGVAWGERHSVARWSPQRGPFRDLCMAMLKLSGITVRPEDVY